MMARSHLAVSGALATTGFIWLSTLRQPTSGPGAGADAWVRKAASWPMNIVGRDVPAWVSDQPVSEAAQWIWAWLFPFSPSFSWTGSDADRLGLIAYLVLATLLLAVGSLLPDLDSKSSLLARRTSFVMPGPHRGLLHTDWMLIALFAVSLLPPARLIVWLWLGAWLHCELDGLSASGRVRFYPFTRYRLVALSGGEYSVGRVGRRTVLYYSGTAGEAVLVIGLLTACAAAVASAFL